MTCHDTKYKMFYFLFQDEDSKEQDDYNYGINSGDSSVSRIFIKGWGSGKSSSDTSGYVDGQVQSNGDGESNVVEYMRAQPDNMAETSGLAGGDYNNSNDTENESPNVGVENKAFRKDQSVEQDQAEEHSLSSSIQLGKVSESDSNRSSCASSGIGQEASTCFKTPALGEVGLFAHLTADDLKLEDSDDDDGYRGVAGNSSLSDINKLSQFDDFQNEETNSNLSNIDISLPQENHIYNSDNRAASPVHVPNSNPSHAARDQNHTDSLVSVGQQIPVSLCSSCRKRHEQNIKCGLTSPELRAHQRNRQKRVDSSCSDESIPMGLLNGSTSEFSVDTSPNVNSKLQLLPSILSLNSSATSC